MNATAIVLKALKYGAAALIVMSLTLAAQEGNSSSDTDAASAAPASNVAETSSDRSATTVAQPQQDFIWRLGTPFPLEFRADGLKLGPFYMTDFAVSGFYSQSSAPGEAAASAVWGSVINPEFILNHKNKRTQVVLQMNPYISVAGTTAYYSQNSGFNLISQLTQKLSLTMGTTVSYLQNSYFQNPQYLLGYTGTGFVLQTISAQYTGSSFSAANTFGLNYLVSGRTQISFTPVVSSIVLNQFGQWSDVQQFGGGISVTRAFDPSRTGSVSYTAVHSINSLDGGAAAGGWTTQTFAFGFQQRIGHSWWFSGNLGASLQQEPLSSWTPTGSLTVMRSFRRSSITGAYTRTRADQILLSSGYFDQGDLSYSATLSSKWQFTAGVGEYRTVQTATTSHGKRANGTLFYMLRPSCSLFAQYNFIHQSGTAITLYNGDNSYLSFGVRWNLKRRPQL